MNTTTLQNIALHTQKRLNNWYKDVKQDYNIDGQAEVSINNQVARIKYTENNRTKIFEEKTMYLENESIDYLFNIWSEA